MMTSKEIGTLALEAMLFEVSATPKPGLVDRNNSGAHRDMSFFTFMESAASLRESFEDFAEAGFNFDLSTAEAVPLRRGGVSETDRGVLQQLFPLIRKIGIEAEKKMFKATNGINTHKGEIFSLGLLSTCAGYLIHNGKKITVETLTDIAKKMCSGLCGKDFSEVYSKTYDKLTKGEKVYLKYGVTGIRGEAEAGYPVVKNFALPALKKYLSEGFNINDALAFTLIHIMANASDTNIISRHDIQTAEKVMTLSKKLLEKNLTLQEIYELDEKFIAENPDRVK